MALFWDGVKFSRINANNYLFYEIQAWFSQKSRVSLYLSKNLRRDWQFVQNRWVKHPFFLNCLPKMSRLWRFFSIKIKHFGNLTGVKQIPCVISPPKKEWKTFKTFTIGVRPPASLMAIFSRLCLPYLFPLQLNPIYKMDFHIWPYNNSMSTKSLIWTI